MGPITVIIGPTGIGKTEFAIAYAATNQAEIISADAFQIYQGMAIGTAQPTPLQSRSIHHHLIAERLPSEAYSVSQFIQLANAAITDSHSRQKPVIICGGTGLYLRAWLYGYTFQKQKKETSIRQDIHIIGLTADRDTIYRRINDRVDMMIANGLIDEVATLIRQGYPPSLPAFDALGYRDTMAYLRNDISLSTLTKTIKQRSRQFAKRQLTWFRKFDGVHWRYR